MTNNLIRDGIREMERRIPSWAKGLAILSAMMSFGFIANDFVSAQMDLLPRVTVIENHVEESEPLLKYLVCKDLAQEPSACIFILRESRYFNEFSQLGIIQSEQSEFTP